MIFRYTVLLLMPLILLFYGCNHENDKISVKKPGRIPHIEPDYTSIIIPPDIAPLNFVINEEGSVYYVDFSIAGNSFLKLTSRNKIIKIPSGKWKHFLQYGVGKEFLINVKIKEKSGEEVDFEPIKNRIAAEPADRYITYRVIYPGYESWRDIEILQRDLTDFASRVIIKNTVAEENCVNCHSFNNGRTDDFLFHMRGSRGGTYFLSDGMLENHNLKPSELKNGAVYPRWHPSGRFVAFSSNKIVQRFHALDTKKVEVSDLESSLVLYDKNTNEMLPVFLNRDSGFMDTYPEWSPDGKTLYFCRAPQIGEIYDYRSIHYNLWKVTFDPDKRTFGKDELVYDASKEGKSISFPRISPDGKYITVTLADYGCFPIWHKEADIFALDLETGSMERLELNSEFTDSYHSFSSNGHWIVFASRRGNGSVTRPYIAYFDEKGKSGKAFLLPQSNPLSDKSFLRSFNLPEFSTLKLDFTPGQIRRASKKEAINAKWFTNDSI
ncbi:MAG TPA: cytochrome C biosynthesis protein [Bacteroidales bacterium]|nr:cytochrome C biosynthesis protein [Bacteroidales bacterium]HQG52638.1 cytochrome C biosynthesis protein [Bacteroidales bacterium]HRC90133.1 cytochrome C biosynthesis protein [Bacteroidales bacterium]